MLIPCDEVRLIFTPSPGKAVVPEEVFVHGVILMV